MRMATAGAWIWHNANLGHQTWAASDDIRTPHSIKTPWFPSVSPSLSPVDCVSSVFLAVAERAFILGQRNLPDRCNSVGRRGRGRVRDVVGESLALSAMQGRVSGSLAARFASRLWLTGQLWRRLLQPLPDVHVIRQSLRRPRDSGARTP